MKYFFVRTKKEVIQRKRISRDGRFRPVRTKKRIPGMDGWPAGVSLRDSLRISLRKSSVRIYSMSSPGRLGSELITSLGPNNVFLVRTKKSVSYSKHISNIFRIFHSFQIYFRYIPMISIKSRNGKGIGREY